MIGKHVTESKVDHANVTVFIEENVFCFQIAMDYFQGGVDVFERDDKFTKIFAGDVFGEGSVSSDQIKKITVRYVFHNKDVLSFKFKIKIEFDKKRMIGLTHDEMLTAIGGDPFCVTKN